MNCSPYCMRCGEHLTTGDADGLCSGCRANTANEGGASAVCGWECPRCGKVNAPWMPWCDCHAPVETTLSNSSEPLETE